MTLAEANDFNFSIITLEEAEVMYSKGFISLLGDGRLLGFYYETEG